jgi:Domain found in Dishevelled, Egl-10, and Pleckstrin (DEP)
VSLKNVINSPLVQTDAQAVVEISLSEVLGMNTTVLLALPHESAHKYARALVMALGLIPERLGQDAHAMNTLVAHLQHDPRSAAMLDLGSLPDGVAHIIALTQRLPQALRSRVILFRHEQGPVWPSDQAWASDLGFAGLFAELDAQAMLTDEAVPQLLARLTGQPLLPSSKLAQYFAAMLAKPDPLTLRGLIRAQCGRSAESLAQVMASGVKATDHSYRLKSYPACFLGTDAVGWLRGQFKCSSASAVQMGQALLSLGLMHHVVHEHAFENQPFYYRLDATSHTSDTHLGQLLEQLKARKGLEVKDRSYLGRKYPACWVGKEAVTWLSEKQKQQRHEAENLLNRLLGYGLIEHVLQAHRIKDDHLYYRFR